MAAPGPPMSPEMLQKLADSPENQEKIANAGRIPRDAFIGSIGAFFGVAVIAVSARIISRVVARRRLYTDDAFLLFALACICTGTGLITTFYHEIFIGEAVSTNPTVVIMPDQVAALFDSFIIMRVFFCIIWTVTFSVKASFLALFKRLIRRVSKQLTLYYWSAVVLTFLSWAFFMCELFIVCPYTGTEIEKCLPQTPYVLTLSLTALGTALDIITDVMIVSIPILILRKAKIKLSQKIALGFFLCLSLVMICIAFVRAAGFRIGEVEDLTWSLYWIYMEACVACIMASITAIRTVFGSTGSRGPDLPKQRPSYSMRMQIMRKVRRSGWDEVEEDGEKLPEIPSATLSGMRTFVRRNHRTAGETTVMQSTFRPEDMEDSERGLEDNKTGGDGVSNPKS